MVRTAQTARTEGPDFIHNRTFTDQAGNTAIRARWSVMSERIPDEFHSNPLFCFQLYTTIPLDLHGPSTKRNWTARSGSGSDFSGTALEEVLHYAGSSTAWRRDLPGWEIYSVENVGALECVEHQRREIASRKGRREDPGVNPIPKVAHWGHLSYTPEMLGFVIVVDTASFKHADAMNRSVLGPQWVFFDRHTPKSMDWSVESRLDGDPKFLASGMCEPPRAPTVLPERLDTAVIRVQHKADYMEEQLSWIHHSSSGADHFNDPPAAGPEDIMDVGWRETGGNPNEAEVQSTAAGALRNLAAQLNIDGLIIKRGSSTTILISNAQKGADPDLRYVVYIPLLTKERTEVTLEEAAKAFTQAVTSRFPKELPKTVFFFFFEFHEPTSVDKTSMLRHYRSRAYPSDFTGAITTFPDREGETIQKQMRARPIARTEYAAHNDPDAVEFEPYRTFLIILEEVDFSTVPGRISFLLTDGGKCDGEDEDYPETLLWRCAGLDEVSRRLQMIWGGVKWERPIL